MSKHQVSELTGHHLDIAVARAEGLIICESGGAIWARDEHGNHMGYITGDSMPAYSPSKLWQQGGPIIEREGLSLMFCDSPTPSEAFWNTATHSRRFKDRCPESGLMEPRFIDSYGPTPLVAAMRAFVRAHIGEEVDLP